MTRYFQSTITVGKRGRNAGHMLIVNHSDDGCEVLNALDSHQLAELKEKAINLAAAATLQPSHGSFFTQEVGDFAIACQLFGMSRANMKRANIASVMTKEVL